MAEPSGWARLGDALGGDSELEYQKGLQLGANTENALAQASERRTKAKAQMELAGQLKAAGFSQVDSDASATALTAGANLGDVFGMREKQQEYNFRNDAAGVTGLDQATGNRRLMGVASGPVDRYQISGGTMDDRFDTAGPTAAPGGGASGGTSAAMQLLRAYGLLDESGYVKPGMEAQAFDVMRSTERNFDVGGQPSVVTANPFRRGPGGAPGSSQLAPISDVAGNEAERARQKEVGQASGQALAKLPDTLADIEKMRGNIQSFMKMPGFRGVYGNIQGLAPVGAAMDVIDQDVADARAAMQNLDAQAFGVSIQKMIGLGHLSNAEGSRITQAYTMATNPMLDEKTATGAWGDVLDGLDRAEGRAYKKAYMDNTGGSPGVTVGPSGPPQSAPATAAAPAATKPVEARISTDAEFDALPSGTVFVGPDGKRRVKP